MKKKRDCRERQKIQDGGAGGGEKGGNPRTVELVEGKKGKISKWHRMLTFHLLTMHFKENKKVKCFSHNRVAQTLLVNELFKITILCE